MNTISNGYGFGTLFNHQGFGLGGANGVFGKGGPSGIRKGTSETIATEIVSHVEAPDLTELEGLTEEEVLEQFSEDKQALAGAIADTIDYVANQYGDKAATAVAGIIKSKTGNGALTEENLGDGLLSATKFIDQQFGIEEGDKFMAHLNDNLNEEMNTFFDNGLNERFFAVSPGFESMSQSFSMALNKVADKYGNDAADSILSMIENLVENGENPEEAIKKGLADADELLKKQTEDPAATFSGLLAQNVAQGAGPQVGQLLNISV